MGNSLGGQKRCAKIMKVDGTTFRIKPPAQASHVLLDHPGHHLLESSDVKRLGIRAQPLDPDTPLKPGKIYFLVDLPRLPDHRVPRRAWSGALHVSARDRLESLKLSRRTVSDLSMTRPVGLEAAAAAEETKDGAMRVRVRLPKAQVARLMEESVDAADAAEKIMELFVAREAAPPPKAAAGEKIRKEKRTRFMAMPEEIIA